MLIAGLSDGRDQHGRLKIRVWTDHAEVAPVRCLYAASARPISATVEEVRLPPSVAASDLYRRRVFEIGGLPPDAHISVSVGDDECRVRTLPESGNALQILLASCFYAYAAGDPLSADNGALARSQEALPDKPHLRILCGDQLYLDAQRLRNDIPVEYATRSVYRRYWSEYAGFLSSGLSVFAPDDHEFWNDYPRPMPWLSRSWSSNWRAHARAAMLANHAFQTITNPSGKNWFSLDLGVVALFVSDLRSERSYSKRGRIVWDESSEAWVETGRSHRLCPPSQMDALEAWAARLDKPGLLVLNQPLFQRAGTWSDKNILSFPEDARRIWNAVERAPRSIVVLAGDIHWARAGSWSVPAGEDTRFEIVASPSRLLKPVKIVLWTIGERKVLKSPSAEIPPSGPAGAAQRRLQAAYGTSVDNFALLHLRPRPGRVELRVRAVAADGSARTAQDAFGTGRPCERIFSLH